METLERAIALANEEDVAKDDRCPFCHVKPTGHATKKPEQVSDKVTSIPDALKCENAKAWRDTSAAIRRDTGDLPYTLAKHHLISAMQCYARIRRLARMGNMVGYDINNEVNGIGLPTTHWTLTYPVGSKRRKYGDLDEPEGKKAVAFALMKELGAQWHVGHHAFEVSVSGKSVDKWAPGGTDEKSEEDYPHEAQYDLLVIARLLQLVKGHPPDFCKQPDRDDVFKENMNTISTEIRGYLEKFNGKNGSKPADSEPFFVSMRAYEYSGVTDNLPNKDVPPQTAPFKQRK